MIPAQPRQPRGADISVSDVDGVSVVGVRGVVDLLSAPSLRTRVEEALGDRPRALIIDLTDVDFFASVGLEVLVGAHRTAGSATKVVVVAEGPATSRPIRITGVDRIVPLYPTLGDATDALASA